MRAREKGDFSRYEDQCFQCFQCSTAAAPPSACPLRALKKVHSPPTTFPPFAQPVAERKCQARSSSTSRKCTGRKVASSTPYSSRAPSPPRRKKVRPRLIRQRLATGEPHLKSPQIGVACDLSCVGERAGCCGRWRAVLHLAVGQIAKSTALSYTCTTSTRCQHTHAHQPLATRGVRKPYRTTAGLA